MVNASTKHGGGELAIALLVQWTKSVEHLLVILQFFVHDTRIERGSYKIMRRGDGMNITGEMQVEIFHRDDL